MTEVRWNEGTIDGGAYGRNGMMKTNGLSISRGLDNETIDLRPINSRNDVGNCRIAVPQKDRARVAAAICPALLDALRDVVWQLEETAAFDDARKGEDDGLLEDVKNARQLLDEMQGEAAE